MNFKTWLGDEINNCTPFGCVLGIFLICFALSIVTFLFLIPFTYPLALLVYVVVLFIWGYYKYKKETKNDL